eukprot:scaffold12417_cov131-Isochrysis_galbana.AAC.9
MFVLWLQQQHRQQVTGVMYVCGLYPRGTGLRWHVFAVHSSCRCEPAHPSPAPSTGAFARSLAAGRSKKTAQAARDC